MRAADDETISDLLQRVAAEARPARLPKDLWSQGRHRHRRRVGAVVAALLLALAVTMPTVFASGLRRAAPADDQPSIPSRIHSPIPMQSTVEEDPAGPATVILTGPGGFGVGGLAKYEDRALVIGRNGSYRWSHTSTPLTPASPCSCRRTAAMSPGIRALKAVATPGGRRR